MRFLWGEVMGDWKFWGLLNKDVKWFFGYSQNIGICEEK